MNAIKPAYIKTDLTAAEFASRIGRSTTFVHKLMHDGKIEYYEREYRGKRTYLVKPEELVRFVDQNQDAGKADIIYDKRSGIFLFQPYSNAVGERARIMSMKRVSNRKIEAILRTFDNQEIGLEKALSDGWTPVKHITEKKPNTAYGHARFEFPAPTMIDSMIFRIIEEFFKQVGPANMKISNSDGDVLIVEVKKSVLIDVLPSTHPDLIDKLKLFIRSGEIIDKYDGTLIDTGLSPVTIFFSEQQKKKFIELARSENSFLAIVHG